MWFSGSGKPGTKEQFPHTSLGTPKAPEKIIQILHQEIPANLECIGVSISPSSSAIIELKDTVEGEINRARKDYYQILSLIYVNWKCWSEVENEIVMGELGSGGGQHGGNLYWFQEEKIQFGIINPGFLKHNCINIACNNLMFQITIRIPNFLLGFGSGLSVCLSVSVSEAWSLAE